MRSEATQHLQLKLLLPFFISVVLILVSIFVSQYNFQNKEQQRIFSTVERQLKNQFLQNIADDTKLLGSALLLIQDNIELQRAWKAKDRNALLELSSPIFNKLLKYSETTHFYFHNLDGTNFLRVHSPERHGDTINRASLKKAIKTKKQAVGLELGPLGQFVLRVVVPWRVDNEIVGYIELGQEIEHVFNQLSANNNYDFFLAVNKSYLNKVSFDVNLVSSKSSILSNDLKEMVITNSTIKHLNPKVVEWLDKGRRSDSVSYQKDGKTYTVAEFHIDTLLNKNIASVYYITDITSHIENLENYLINNTIIISIIGFIILVFYYFYSKQIQNTLFKSYHSLENEITERRAIQSELIQSRVKLETLVQERDESLEDSQNRYQTLFSKTADALLLIEGQSFVDCNQAALDMLMFSTKQELYNTHPSKLSPEFQPDGQSSELKANHMMELAFENGSHRFEWEHTRKNGKTFPVEVLLTAVPQDGEIILHVVWRDISDRIRAAAEIERQAYYDSLTGLPNRKLLLDRLNQTLITSRRHGYFAALLFIDLDRFKTINDSLGHSVGDLLLVQAAARIKNCIRDEDTASRFGGDEYIVLLRHLGSEKQTAGVSAKKIAKNIQDSISKEFLIKENVLHITISIGISLFPDHEGNVEDIIKHADTAMYSAKKNGRNQIEFYLSEMHQKVLEKLTLEKDLRTAIQHEQLEVYYQPLLNSKGKIQAVEALARWNHEKYGFVNPEEFVSIAENTGMIFELGEFVLKKSTNDILEINQTLNKKLNLSVNISTNQFRNNDFVNQIKSHVENYKLDKFFLTLELTESIAIDNLNQAINSFDQLRHIGVRLSLDDFGTGYSSLSHLKRLPIHELKIDKSFVFDIEDDPQDAILVKAIIKIAHQFGLEVVAEGVETKNQLDFLKKEGCDILQGYFYSRPLPIDELRAYIQSES